MLLQGSHPCFAKASQGNDPNKVKPQQICSPVRGYTLQG